MAPAPGRTPGAESIRALDAVRTLLGARSRRDLLIEHLHLTRTGTAICRPLALAQEMKLARPNLRVATFPISAW